MMRPCLATVMAPASVITTKQSLSRAIASSTSAASPSWRPVKAVSAMAREKFRAALIQMRCGPEPEQNVARALDMVREAARKGAQIVCLPELFRTQYFCQRQDAELFDLAEPVPGPTIHAVAEVARATG